MTWQLPTLDDEQALWNVQSIKECHSLYTGQGVSELVIKGADLTAYAFAGSVGETLQAQAVTAVDTTGAGDAFNAAYVTSRFSGGDLQTALSQAQALAALVVQQRGAILPRS